MNPDVLETLVQKVTEEVHRRLQSSIPDPKINLVILSAQPVPELEAMLNGRFAVSYYREGVSDCDVVLIPEVGIQLLANLANGLSPAGKEQFIFTMLLKGKKVFALEEGFLYRNYKQTAPYRLYNMYEAYAETIQKYGICSVTESMLQRGFLRNELPVAEAAGEETTKPVTADNRLPKELTQKVVTEADLKKYYLQHITELVIGQKSLLTPLAQDYLKAQQMTVRRKT